VCVTLAVRRRVFLVVELRGYCFSKLEKNCVLENYYLPVRKAVEKLQISKVMVKAKQSL